MQLISRSILPIFIFLLFGGSMVFAKTLEEIQADYQTAILSYQQSRSEFQKVKEIWKNLPKDRRDDFELLSKGKETVLRAGDMIITYMDWFELKVQSQPLFTEGDRGMVSQMISEDRAWILERKTTFSNSQKPDEMKSIVKDVGGRWKNEKLKFQRFHLAMVFLQAESTLNQGKIIEQRLSNLAPSFDSENQREEFETALETFHRGIVQIEEKMISGKAILESAPLEGTTGEQLNMSRAELIAAKDTMSTMRGALNVIFDVLGAPLAE